MKKYQCEYCRRRFKKEEGLKTHMMCIHLYKPVFKKLPELEGVRKQNNVCDAFYRRLPGSFESKK